MCYCYLVSLTLQEMKRWILVPSSGLFDCIVRCPRPQFRSRADLIRFDYDEPWEAKWLHLILAQSAHGHLIHLPHGCCVTISRRTAAVQDASVAKLRMPRIAKERSAHPTMTSPGEILKKADSSFHCENRVLLQRLGADIQINVMPHRNFTILSSVQLLDKQQVLMQKWRAMRRWTSCPH